MLRSVLEPTYTQKPRDAIRPYEKLELDQILSDCREDLQPVWLMNCRKTNLQLLGPMFLFSYLYLLARRVIG